MKFLKEWGFFMFWLIALIGLFSSSSRAEDYSLKFGPGIEDASAAYTKMFGARREEELMDGLHDAFEVGGLIDNYGHGHRSTGFGKIQIGVKPGPEVGGFAKAFVGPCVITSPDAMLGGEFPQFATDIGLGVRDKKSFVVINYSHISSAGLRLPNHGRDAVMFEAGLRY